MGILDELKQEADQVRLDREREAARQAELERAYQMGIRPALMNIHKYLADLIEQLNTVTWAVTLSFDFPGIGRADKLKQMDYSLSIDSQRNPKLIILRFDCVAPIEKRYVLPSRAALDDAVQFLNAQKIAFSDWALRGGNHDIIGFVIQAKLRVKTSFAFEADVENSSIWVTTLNYQGVVEKRFMASYQSINDEWLDQLGHYVLRKKSAFGKLDISEEERQRIRSLLEEERREYEAQLATTKVEMVSEDKLLPKLWKLFGKSGS